MLAEVIIFLRESYGRIQFPLVFGVFPLAGSQGHRIVNDRHFNEAGARGIDADLSCFLELGDDSANRVPRGVHVDVHESRTC